MQSNRVTLEAFADMPLSEAAALGVDELAMLADDIADREAATKKQKAALTNVVMHKFAGDLAGHALGTKRIKADGVDVVVNLPKKVEWDQDKLASVAQVIEYQWGSRPADYMKFKRDVSEAAYANWPPEVRDLFEPARTVKVGSPTVKFERKGAA